MNRPASIHSAMRPLLPFTLLFIVFLAVAGQAWSQCSITSGGSCSGACPAGQVCKSDGKDSYSCSCQTAGSTKALGSLFDATGGTISFDGTSLSVSNMTITNVYDKFNGVNVPNDPIIGASIIFPTMTFSGFDTFNNGVTSFQYYDFKDLSGDPFQIVKGSTVLLSASIDDTWYMLNTNSFSGNDLTNIVYDSGINSQFLSQLLQYSTIAQPATVVTSSTDFNAGSAGFTQPYSTAATEEGGECASTPEPGAWMLGAVGLGLLALGKRRRPSGTT